MKRHILLVDDEPAILQTMKTILEVHGFEIETAASGKEAIAKLSSGRFHLVMTDIRMEHDKAGYEVIQAAEKMEYDPAIAVLTAYPLGCDWKPEKAGSVLVKPMNATDLLLRIELLLTQHEGQKQQRILARATAEDGGKTQATKKTA